MPAPVLAPRPLLAALIAAAVGHAAPALAQDSDSDGAPDAADRFPCDASAAGELFAPAEGRYGLLAIEDHYPAAFDFDFNDVVLAHHARGRVDALGRVTELELRLVPLALGGTFDNGLGLHLPIPRGAVQAVTRQVQGGEPTALTPSPADQELTVTVLDDLRALFGGQAGPINSAAGPAQAGSSVTVRVTFSSPQALSFADAPWDTYVFRAGQPSLQVHRPRYPGTAAMDTTLFGTGVDGSGGGRFFVHTGGVPFVLSLPEVTAYPAEGEDISALFPDIVAFGASGGQLARDFYTRAVDAHAYAQPVAPDPLPVAAPADTSCLAPAIPAYTMGACPSFVDGSNGIVSAGVPRTTTVLLPPNPQGAPVLFVWHWTASSVSGIEAVYTHGYSGLVNEGVIVVAPDGITPPFHWAHNQGPTDNADLVFFDDLLACLVDNFAIDVDRVWSMGHSSGGLMTSYLQMHRGEHFAATAALSGGRYGGVAGGSTSYDVYHSPRNPYLPTLLVWGGAADYYAPTGLHFDVASLRLSQELRGDGHFVVECDFGYGHTIPQDTMGPGAYVWQFLRAHTRGGGASPFATGLGSGFPSYCRIP